MKHVVVLNPKGGCGKTTIATHLAVYASTLGLRVALADHDQQASSHDWIASRPRRCADIGSIAAYDGEEFASADIEMNYDVVVHDLPASVALDGFDLHHHCHKLIIPIMPSPIDIKAAMRLWMQLSDKGVFDEQGIDIGVVANRVKSVTKYAATLDDFIERLGLKKIATLRDTQNYIRSLDAGLSLFDMPPNRVAKDLIQWQPLMEWTGFFDIDDEELFDLLGQEGLSFDALGVGSKSVEMPSFAAADDCELVSFEDMQSEQLQEESGFSSFGHAEIADEAF